MKNARLFSFLLVFNACILAGYLAGAFTGRSIKAGDRFDIQAAQPAPTQEPGLEISSLPAGSQAGAGQGSGSSPAGSPAETLPTPTSSPSPAPTAAALPSPEKNQNGERSILAIGVDRLEAPQPRLESIWLVQLNPSLSRIALTPAYPAALEYAPGLDRELESAFHLDESLAPDAEFLAILQAQEFRWHNYAILDQIGLAELIEVASGSEPGSGAANGLRAVASLTHPWEDPRAALLSQNALIQSMCRKTLRLPGEMNILKIIDIMAHHFHTDLSDGEISAAAGQMLASRNGLVCEFPGLNLANLLPAGP